MIHEQDRDLLLGVLAVRSGLVDQARLFSLLQETAPEDRPALDVLLKQRSLISPREMALLNDLVGSHLERLQSAGSRSDTDEPANAFSLASTWLHPPQAGETSIAPTEAPDDATDVEADPLIVRLGSTLSEGRDGPSGAERYEVLREHARGGLGMVSIARDLELNRDVALKEMRRDRAAGEDDHARFLLEAEITGCLEHPGVVPVYGLGRYADGRPFYAMRFIRGESLLEAIRSFHDQPGPFKSGERWLQLRRLLTRFVELCHVMEYAHARGVIHRDLKPDNIMLGPYGETLVVDWGLAKVLDDVPAATDQPEPLIEQLQSTGSQTLEGSVAGTPAYMSPEQAAGKIQDLGTASDIFSLGATLYHLLTGRPPYRGDPLEILESVRQAEFTPPREVRGDLPRPLAAICAKAMEKRPADRYASAQEIGADLERWLADEPTTAFPETIVHRGGRWLRKHRDLALVGTSLLLLLAIGATTAAIVIQGQKSEISNLVVLERGARRQAEDAREDAEGARDVADEQRAEAEAARDEAENVTNFLVNAFRSPDPSMDGKAMTVYEVLHRVRQDLAADATATPRSRAEFLEAIGKSFMSLGEYADAEAVLRESVELHGEVFGPTHYETLLVTGTLASSVRDAGDPAESLALLEELVGLMESVQGEHHKDSIALRDILATTLETTGESAAALEIFERNLELAQRHHADDDSLVLLTMNNLATALQRQQRHDLALPLHEQVYAWRAANLRPNHPDTLTSRDNLASALADTGQVEESLVHYEAVLEGRLEEFGPSSPITLTTMSNYAVSLDQVGRADEAVELLEQALAEHILRVGPLHEDTLITQLNLVKSLMTLGRHDEALEMAEATYGGFSQIKPPYDFYRLLALQALASALGANERYDEAVERFREARDIVADIAPAEAPVVLSFNLNLANVLIDRRAEGDDAEAEEIVREALEHLPEDGYGPELTRPFLEFSLGTALIGQGRLEEGLPLAEAGYAYASGSIHEVQLAGARLAAEVSMRLEDLGEEEAAELWRDRHDELTAAVGGSE